MCVRVRVRVCTICRNCLTLDLLPKHSFLLFSPPFLGASSALLLPFHSWKEHKNDGVSRNFFELIYRLCFPARPPIYGSIQSVYSIRVTTANKPRLCVCVCVNLLAFMYMWHFCICLFLKGKSKGFSCRRRTFHTPVYSQSIMSEGCWKSGNGWNYLITPRPYSLHGRIGNISDRKLCGGF